MSVMTLFVRPLHNVLHLVFNHAMAVDVWQSRRRVDLEANVHALDSTAAASGNQQRSRSSRIPFCTANAQHNPRQAHALAACHRVHAVVRRLMA